MASGIIGALRVNLGLDSAAFTAGAEAATKASSGLQKGLSRIGNGATALGKKLSVVSAGMAALGTAAFAAVKGTADAGQMIERQSQIANAGFREFQLMAAGARSVGIENDKLADILKDVNDRVGDFIQTGGGPMADFFENIAPKVGVTADQFKELSGPQALQLYVSSLEKAGLSQQEMTFYLEAMASDATALIPLLQNGGAEMTRLGQAADGAGGIMSDKAIKASSGFNSELRRLTDGAQGLRNKLAEALMPAMTNLMATITDNVIPAATSMVEKIGEWITWFGELPGPIQEAAAVIALALGTGGPILLAVGVMATALSGLVAATGPVGLFIAAAALAVAAWTVWGDDIKSLISSAIGFISDKFDAFIGKIKSAIQWATDLGTKISEALGFGRELEMMRAQQQQRADFTGRAIGGAVSAGLMSGIGQGLNDGEADLRSYLNNSVIDPAKDELGIHSPSRVFREIGQFVTQGLGLGIRDGVPEVDAAMQSVTDAVSDGGGLISGLEGFRDVAETVFRSVAIEGKKLGDVLRDLASNWLGNAANSLMGSAFDTLFGIGANANGTNNWRGGLTRVNERGGEIMNLPRGTQIIPNDISKRMASAAGASGPVQISVNVSGARGNAEIESMVAQGVRSGIAQYDRQALPMRIKQISADGRRIG